MATTEAVRRLTQAAFPVDDPVQALMRDHHLIRKLADTYLTISSPDAKKQAATQLVHALHIHSRLEEGVFYPAVRRVDPNLVARFEEDHLDVDDMLVALQGMALDEARAEALLRTLIAAVLKHIHEEETELFTELRRAALDLSPIGLEMQAFEANLVHSQAQLSDRCARQ